MAFDLNQMTFSTWPGPRLTSTRPSTFATRPFSTFDHFDSTHIRPRPGRIFDRSIDLVENLRCNIAFIHLKKANLKRSKMGRILQGRGRIWAEVEFGRVRPGRGWNGSGRTGSRSNWIDVKVGSGSKKRLDLGQPPWSAITRLDKTVGKILKII